MKNKLIILASVLVMVFIAGAIWYYLQPVEIRDVLASELFSSSDTPEATAGVVSKASVQEVSEENKDASEESAYMNIETLDDFGKEKWNEGPVMYEGKVYKFNNDLQNYLILGIDNDNIVAPAEDGISGGQSDGMFLLSLDNAKRKISVIAINRNTMVPVDVYDREGNFLLQMNLQICLQHGYGDGMKLSCMRSVEAVDRLFHGIPISGYMSLNMGGLPAVNDAVGGVAITPIESVERGDVVINAGEPVVLNGEQAYAYLRTRDTDKFASADDRLKRQEQYIKSFIRKLMADPGLANKVYESGKDYLVASIDLPRLIENSKDMTFDDSDFYTIDGETVLKDDFECYNIDESALIRLILNVFYEETDV